jgi:hypothetical protein
VHECGVTIRDQPIEKHFKVAPHIRVRVFLNQQRGRSMQDLQGGKTGVKLFFSDPGLDPVGELVKSATSRRDPQLV